MTAQFIVTAVTGSTTLILQNTGNTAVKVAEAVIAQEKNAIDSFTFTAYPIYGTNGKSLPELQEMKTTVTVRDSTTGKYHFRGRVLKITPQMGADGTLCKKVVCEGELAYLCDSVQPYTPPTQYSDGGGKTGLQKFIDFLLENHNDSVETAKQIHRGVVDLQTYQTSGGVYKGTNWQTTWEIITEKLVKVFGGEIRLRHETDGLYLDYRETCGTTKQTEIEFGENLQSITQNIDATKIVTRIVPLGCKLMQTSGESPDEEGEERLTIESVNGGVPWIESSSAALLYGIRYVPVIWDDVTIAQNLYNKGLAYLQAQNELLAAYDVSAVDMSFLGSAAAGLELYDWYPVSNSALGISETLEIVRIEKPLDAPYSPRITMGEVQKPLSGITGDDISDIGEKLNNVDREVYRVGYRLRTQFQAADGELLAHIERVEQAVENIGEFVEISATSQFFTKSAEASAFSPASIILTANADESIESYRWYKNDVIISGATGQTLTVYPSDVSGNQAVFKCVITDLVGAQYHDQITIAKISDGQDGSPGADGYTVLLSNEYISVAVDTSKKPKTTQNINCVVSVFKGLAALTAVNTTPRDGQFRVTTGTAPTGVTVSQNTAGTLVLGFSSARAIANSSRLSLTITVDGGLTLSAAIQISAEMMDVIVSHDSEIKELDDQISLKVSQTTYAKAVPTYSATNPATSWTTAEKAANVGFLWWDTTNAKMKRWSGSAWVDVTAQNADQWASYSAAQITILHNDILLRVEKDGIVNAINVNEQGARIDALKLDLYSRMAVYTKIDGDAGAELAGYLGYGKSNTSEDWGILLQSDTPNTGEVIATDQGARISYAGTTSQVYASQTQAGMIAPGCVIECSSANTGKVIAGYSGGSLSYGNTDLTYDGYSQLTSSQKAERDANMQKVARVYAAEGISGMKSKSVEIASLYEGGVVKLKHAHTTATSPDPDGWSAYWCGGGSGAIFAPDTAYASLGVSSDGSSVDGITLYRWQNGYFKNVYNSAGAITSSDRDSKYEISYDLSKYAGLLDALKPAKFKYIDGESNRTHLGLIAQDVLEEMVYQGLETTDFAGYVYNPDSGTCGIRYDEIIPLLILGYQNLFMRIEEMRENHADDNSVTGDQGA